MYELLDQHRCLQGDILDSFKGLTVSFILLINLLCVTVSTDVSTDYHDKMSFKPLNLHTIISSCGKSGRSGILL